MDWDTTDFGAVAVLMRCGGGSGVGIVSSSGLFAGTVLGGSVGVAMSAVGCAGTDEWENGQSVQCLRGHGSDWNRPNVENMV